MSKGLFDKTYNLCQKWHLKKFTIFERFKDFYQEAIEVFEAILKRKGRKEIGLEYGDILFTFVRHGRGEKKRKLSQPILCILPGKIWLKRKLEVFDKRHDWWMKHHRFHSIRNNKNEEKRDKIIKRHQDGLDGKIWIK